jgi:hypothetical protein
MLAALRLFAIAALIDLATLGLIKLSGTKEGVSVFLLLGMLLGIGGMTVAIITSIRLPQGARIAFWATGVLCIGLMALLWGVTCGMSGTFNIR